MCNKFWDLPHNEPVFGLGWNGHIVVALHPAVRHLVDIGSTLDVSGLKHSCQAVLLVKPAVRQEVHALSRGLSRHFYMRQVPSRSQPAVIMPNLAPSDLANVS
jgi:hypothetical protein